MNGFCRYADRRRRCCSRILRWCAGRSADVVAHYLNNARVGWRRSARRSPMGRYVDLSASRSMVATRCASPRLRRSPLGAESPMVGLTRLIWSSAHRVLHIPAGYLPPIAPRRHHHGRGCCGTAAAAAISVVGCVLQPTRSGDHRGRDLDRRLMARSRIRPPITLARAATLGSSRYCGGALQRGVLGICRAGTQRARRHAHHLPGIAKPAGIGPGNEVFTNLSVHTASGTRLAS